MRSLSIGKSHHRILFAAIMTGIFLFAMLLSSAGALAEPDAAVKQSEVDRIRSEVSSINLTVGQAVERYNQANSELEETRRQIAENEKALADAKIKLDESRQRLSHRLENIYRQGSMSFMDVMLNTTSFNEFLSRFDLLGKIGAQDKSDIDEVLQYKSETEKAQADLDRNCQQQEELVDSIAAEKSTVESQLAARQSVLAGAEGEVAQMLAQEGLAGLPQSTPDSGSGEQADSGSSAPESEPAPDPGPSDSPLPPPNGGPVITAEQYLGVPYVWGGASPSGFDCSGLVMYVFAQYGIYLPHSASAQYYSGTPVSRADLAPGDLVFFGNPIYHVGIYVGGGSMIHAPYEGAYVSITSINFVGSYFGACRL